MRPNVNDSKNADNEELKFILSHSNTFLTNEQVEEKQKYFSKTQNDQKQDQIIDIDGCSEASYSELKESVKSMETKLDRLIGLFYDQANQHK